MVGLTPLNLATVWLLLKTDLKELLVVAPTRPPSLFDKDNAQPAKADDQADAARNFLEDYTADVQEGANIRSDINDWSI